VYRFAALIASVVAVVLAVADGWPNPH
jgi:hypothetical protein